MLRRFTRKRKAIPPDGKQVIVQFFENTSIHGLKYVFEKGTTLLERLAWIFIFSSGIFFSGYFCFQMWQKWDQSPILTSVETQLYPLKYVLFPAITICNVNKVSKRKLAAALENPKFANVSYNNLQITLRYMTKLDRAITNESNLKMLDEFYLARNITASDLLKVMEETAPSCSDMIIDCNWLGLPSPCMEFFSFLPTDDGMCCIFNGPNNLNITTVSSLKEPLRVNGNGYRMGMSLVLDADTNDYSVTNGKFDGFKILVHGSEEFPDVSDRGFVIGPGTETFVGVKGISSFSADEVGKQVSITKRNCLTDGEKKLKNFKDYSQSSCFVECATHLMQQRCGCRPYFFQGRKETNLCQNLTSYTCIAKVYDEMRLGDEICDCMPPCSDTWYEPEISYAPFPGSGFNLTRTFRRIAEKRNLSAKTDSTGYMKTNVAALHVYYKQKTGMRYRTDIRFGIEDFISAIGGLLGLGVGMSFISIIELLYFIFFRGLFLRYRAYLYNQQIGKVNETVQREAVHQGRENINFCASSPTIDHLPVSTISSPPESSKVHFPRTGSLTPPKRNTHKY